jgi:geranylgeranyl diphosphate synthase type I
MTVRLAEPANRNVSYMPAVELVAEAVRPLERRLDELLDGEESCWRAPDPARAYPLQLLGEFVRRGRQGRRVRPVLCYWTYRVLGGNPADSRIVDMCAALELFHSFVLIHDDIVDRAAVRRGAPTVHHRAEIEHRTQGWRGDAHHFGQSMATLVGDLALVLADGLMRAAPPSLQRAYDRMRVELCAAECFEVLATAAQKYDLDASAWISRAKSGDYTGGWPLYAGAVLAGAGPRTAAALRAFGGTVGEVFQLRDDLDGAFGRERETGKSATADLIDGKPTLLVSFAAQKDAPRLRAAMAADRDGFGEHDAETIREALRACGADRFLKDRIGEGTRAADRQLAAVGLAPEAEETLRALTRWVLGSPDAGR